MMQDNDTTAASVPLHLFMCQHNLKIIADPTQMYIKISLLLCGFDNSVENDHFGYRVIYTKHDY